MNAQVKMQAKSQTPLLEIRNLTKVFGGGFLSHDQTVALEKFSMTIEDTPPTITAIAGESGSGKTTLARLVLGFLEPTSGQILYRGQDITGMNQKAWNAFRRDVQAVFQDPYEAYNSFYPVDHIFEIPIQKFHLARTRSEGRQLMEHALEVVGLRPDEILGKYPHELSGGQRQRAMVARAFLLKPRLIVADEPVSMVDASMRAIILKIMINLKDDFGISSLYITHDLSTAFQISNNIVIFYEGSVAESGNAETVIKDPKHPYTQLLVGSIPIPDPDRSWGGRVELPPEEKHGSGPVQGCKFSNRCPHRMNICLKNPPPLYTVGSEHLASCYLYK
jgi:oligopeptide/dipeptide ABC transporter ATP-binding protein